MPLRALGKSVGFLLVLVGALLMDDRLLAMMADALENLGDARIPFFALIAK